MLEVGILEKINKIYSKLDAIDLAGQLFSPEAVAAFQELDDLNITLIVEDLKKGNYLGNRKIDIDLSLNNKSTTSVPTYQKVNIILVDGTIIEMPFNNGSGGIIELSSHGDIKNFIVNHPSYGLIDDTEIVLLEAFNNIPAMIRIRDADGKSSNIERVELFVYSGVVAEPKVNYFWAETTSALQTLANRVGDIIKLGNNFDPMIKLSDKTDELLVLQDAITRLMDIHTNLVEILDSKGYAQIATEEAQVASSYADNAKEQADIATQKANIASNHATYAKEQADLALEKVSTIQSITVQGQTLSAGQSVNVSYNPTTNKFTFSIPKGDKGDRGEAFKVNSIGTFANRALYDNELANFAYLASDVIVDNSVIPHIYFKKSDTSGDWTTGIPFGRGEKGDKGDIGIGITSIARTSGSGIAGTTDTYTITLSDNTTHNFTVYNGKNSDISSSDLNALSTLLSDMISANTSLITNHKNDTNNPHGTTASQVGAYTKAESDTKYNLKIDIANIVDNLTSTFSNKPLSANQGKVLKDAINNINTLLTSSDTTLDQLQEIVDFIKLNKATLDSLGITNIAGLQNALDGKLGINSKAADSDKLDGIDSSEFMRKSQDNTISSNLIFNNGGTDTNGFGFVANGAFQNINVDMINGVLRWFRNNGLQVFSIGTDNNLYSDNGTNGAGKVWTSAIDGTGSGLDADLLDGIHSNGFLQIGFAPADLNTAKTAGSFRINNGHLNCPAGVDYGNLLVLRTVGADTTTQIITDYGSNNIYWRSGSDGGGWAAWRKILTDNFISFNNLNVPNTAIQRDVNGSFQSGSHILYNTTEDTPELIFRDSQNREWEMDSTVGRFRLMYHYIDKFSILPYSATANESYKVVFPTVYTNTSSTGVSVVVDSDGGIRRQSSSLKYKTAIEDIDKSYVDAFFNNARPIYYRDKHPQDGKDWGFWGFIAEEVAKFDKRLVHFRFDGEEVEVTKTKVVAPAEPERIEIIKEEVTKEDGTIEIVDKEVVIPEVKEIIEEYQTKEFVEDRTKPMIAEGIMYDRITVLLTAKVQEQDKEIDFLKAELEELKSIVKGLVG